MIAGMGNDYLDRKTREQCHVQLGARTATTAVRLVR